MYFNSLGYRSSTTKYHFNFYRAQPKEKKRKTENTFEIPKVCCCLFGQITVNEWLLRKIIDNIFRT